jgi:hypothetical protein
MKQDSRVYQSLKGLLKESLREAGIAIEESEEWLRGLLHQAGAAALGESWSEVASREAPEAVLCECGRELKRRAVSKKNLVTLLGKTQVKRAYYWCSRCGKGRYLLDEQLGCRGRAQTGKVQECVALTIAEETYVGGRRLLETLAGLSLGHHTLECMATDMGQALADQTDAEIEQSGQEGLSSQERPKTLCITTDGVKVPLREGWKEARVVAVYDFDVTPGGSDPEPGRICKSARVESSEHTGKRMLAQAQRRGAANAERVVVLGDGADWIWTQSELHFPQAIEVLDWYHATEHLWAVANAVYGQGSPEATAWAKQQEAALWQGEVGEVLEAMRELLWSKRRRDRGFRGSEAEHVLQTNLAYFERHRKRMNYAHFRREKIPIGSGTVESACKHYVAQRCKRSGMRWNKEGLHAVLELRSALLSDEWHRVQNLFKAA